MNHRSIETTRPEGRIIQPSSPQEAIKLLSSTPPPFDSPTNHRYRSAEHLERTFAQRRRRPEWTWVVLDEAGSVLASAAGLDVGVGVAVEHWSAADPAALPALCRAVADFARSGPEVEVSLFTPPEVTATSAEVAPWLSALRAAGWQHLVDRVHLEFQSVEDLTLDEESELTPTRLTGPDDPRLPALLREVLDASLDVHDQQLVAQHGLERAAELAAEQLVEADPWECLRLALTPTGEAVGFVSWLVTPQQQGYLLALGVARAHRGKGHGRQLASLATRALLDEGASTLVADTDVGNIAMVRIFSRIGWPQTETRIDLDLAPTPS